VVASRQVFCLIGCFVFILNLCIFLEMLRSQLVSGGQKTPPLCHDRIVAALFVEWLFLLYCISVLFLYLLFFNLLLFFVGHYFSVLI
jgi:hypothetical protein